MQMAQNAKKAVKVYVGIDVGGTHTDAVLYGHEGSTPLLHSAKVQTHAQSKESVAASMGAALQALWQSLPKKSDILPHIQRITVSTTLGLNALIQGEAAPVGIVYTAGAGMDPLRFLQGSVMGRYAYRVPGGLDHRGCEVTPLDLSGLGQQVKKWRQKGVRFFAVAGKFSVRNACHEQAIVEELLRLGVEAKNISSSHNISGQLNFPRRMAAAYINASICEVQQHFLQAVRAAVQDFFAAQGMEEKALPPLFLLKADGGAIPLQSALNTPLYSVLSGPAASVMGALSLGQEFLQHGADALLLDVGGTTTDMAVYAKGLPALELEGSSLRLGQEDLRTPIRSLATHSLGLGGDTPLVYDAKHKELLLGSAQSSRQQIRQGNAMVFGGTVPTLVDALAVLCTEKDLLMGMDVVAARDGLESLTKTQGAELKALLEKVVHRACEDMLLGLRDILHSLQGRPVYTLAQLLEGYSIQPQYICLVGGPAVLLQAWLQPMAEKTLGARVFVPKHSACANALGAALSLPTDSIYFLADTLQGIWHIPTLSLRGKLEGGFTVEKAQTMALEALRNKAAQEGFCAQEVALRHAEVVQCQCFATLDERGRGGKDIRVQCQWRPGLVLSVPAKPCVKSKPCMESQPCVDSGHKGA